MAAPVSLSRANLVGMMPTPRASLKQPAFAHVCSAFLLIALLSMQLAQFALNQLQSWIREVLGELSLLGVTHPHAYDIHLGSPATSV
eukprot:s1328_g19.t1